MTFNDFLKKAKKWASLTFYFLFKGMESANDVIARQKHSNSDSVSINQQLNGDSVFNDMLEEKETQQVVEFRDKQYRVFKESDKWDTSNIKMSVNYNDNGDEIVTFEVNKLRKKTKEDFMKHPPVYNPENYRVRTIQDNKIIIKDSSFAPTFTSDFDVTLTIERDKITPRFFIEKYTKKIVVRYDDNENTYVDLYLPGNASQFGKVDAILIANLHNMYDTKYLKSDLTDILSIKWVSDKAWNSEDLCLFEYNVINFTGVDKFDGNFILTFKCEPINNGSSLVEKYKTKELDEKYNNNAPKYECTDLFSISRNIDKNKEKKEVDIDNLNDITFKLS